MQRTTLLTFSVLFLLLTTTARAGFEKDVVKTAAGDLEITFIKHGSLMFRFQQKIIYVDPVTQMADYSKLPKADLILITHDHSDHFDPQLIQSLGTDKTEVVITQTAADQGGKGVVLANGESSNNLGLEIEAVPAYNKVHRDEQGRFFHPQGIGNGYVINFADQRVYVAGDTENIPEMKELTEIDIAFLPMNLPYTMTPEMVAKAAASFQPKILYPYHYGTTDPRLLVELMKSQPAIKVRLRKMP